ncbi:MAG: 4-alpha-glucanotransferase [Planctomycetaceae bacterium]|nr:4-alpha-glucanotransferase [Planctomycetaceae bacterium]
MESVSFMNISPFSPDYRRSGVLLHLTSLPSPYGIGDVGVNARRWIDLLRQSGQSWWQFLPLGPAGYGNCPYQQASTFARNSLLISPEQLIAESLLNASECRHPHFPKVGVDFDAVILFKESLIERAWGQFHLRASAELKIEFEQFCHLQSDWLDDFALFECLKRKFLTSQFQTWPWELVSRTPAALTQARNESGAQFDIIRFGQFLVFRQLAQLKAYAASQNLSLIGDLPFFVAPDSCDVWAHPEFYLLDERHHPVFFSGVPPDYFAPEGQFWGHPVFRWETLHRSNYDWWLRRIRNLLAHVDVIRLDHFRAFVAAWHIPAGAKSAVEGTWQPGPGAELFQVLQAELGQLPFLAEDLGLITPDVIQLLNEFELSGMRVLQFAFDGHADNPFLPANFQHNTVAYTGTHDNSTTRGWFESLPEETRHSVSKLLLENDIGSEDIATAMLQLLWSSRAAVTIAPLQDLLSLGPEDRMNVPGRPENNWGWRCSEEIFSNSRFDALFDLTVRTNRNSTE